MRVDGVGAENIGKERVYGVDIIVIKRFKVHFVDIEKNKTF